ncbi:MULTISPECIES: helix-turn-helix domain-containing protein [Rhodomicrobium]|uniref:helix-turn-helix domain-containing protein n=1 Tax=Rhodomicrobium sp. R_RK_3 TaxID=2029567 RepID=UPI002477E099|nr:MULTISPECIES: helix-turn-helix domain-containing protein [Rhodomicrobium]
MLSVFRISALALRSRDRAASVALARQTAMYLAHVAFGLSLTEVGRLFCRDRTTVAHGCMVIEGLRDDPEIDRALALMERAVAPPRTGSPMSNA